MLFCRVAFVLILLLATATAAPAQLPFEHNPKKDPYRHLFGVREPAQKINPSSTVARALPQKPFVLCGTLIVPADPKIDAKIRVTPPKNGVEHKLRIVTPRICRPE